MPAECGIDHATGGTLPPPQTRSVTMSDSRLGWFGVAALLLTVAGCRGPDIPPVTVLGERMEALLLSNACSDDEAREIMNNEDLWVCLDSVFRDPAAQAITECILDESESQAQPCSWKIFYIVAWCEMDRSDEELAAWAQVEVCFEMYGPPI